MKIKTFGLKGERCFESSEFEDKISELEFDAQNILGVIDKRLNNESNQVKETITIKAEELPKLPKI